jgi:hypothetical protein
VHLEDGRRRGRHGIGQLGGERGEEIVVHDGIVAEFDGARFTQTGRPREMILHLKGRIS